MRERSGLPTTLIAATLHAVVAVALLANTMTALAPLPEVPRVMAFVGARPAPPPPPPPAPVRIGGAVGTPQLLHRVEPVIPPAAAAARVESLVVLEATVGTDGHVIDVRVLRSIPALDAAAKDAVGRWRYAPLRVDGRPTPFVLTVTLSFCAATR